MIPVGDLACSLSNVGQVGACCPGLVVEQKSLLDRLRVCHDAFLVSFETFPPDNSLISKEQIKYTDLFVVAALSWSMRSKAEMVSFEGMPWYLGRSVDFLMILSCCRACAMPAWAASADWTIFFSLGFRVYLLKYKQISLLLKRTFKQDNSLSSDKNYL